MTQSSYISIVVFSMGALACVSASCAVEHAEADAADASADAGSDANWSYDGARSACSTGAPANEDFPPIELTHRLEECTPRCGATKRAYANYGSVWTVDALPSGACEYDGEACSMSAVRTAVCDGGQEIACSLTPYACRCESGTWRCYHGHVGRSVCLCSASGVEDEG